MDQNPVTHSEYQTETAPRFCIKCGSALNAGAAFCPKCGTPVKPEKPPAASGPGRPNDARPPYQPAAGSAPGIPGGAAPAGTHRQGVWPPPPGIPHQQAPYQAPYPPQYMNTAPMGGKNSDRETNACTTIGLVGFIVLAILVLAVFLLMHISFVGLAVTLAVLAVLFIVHRLLAKRSILATVLLIVAALVFSFILLVAFLPADMKADNTDSAAGHTSGSGIVEGEETLVIEPSDEDIVIDYDDFTIMIPGGTVSQDETLTVTEPENMPAAFEGYEAVCPAIDVDLGELRQFDTPLEIEIPYDKSALEDIDIDPDEAFIAVYYSEDTGYWEDVPYEVDEDTGVVRLIMYHLTTVRCYYSMWESSLVYDNGSAMVIYITGGGYGSRYETYEQAVGRTTGNKYIPQFVVDVADYAVKILDAYKSQGLPVISYPHIYITTDDNHYGTLSGRVFLAADVCRQDNPEINMAANLGHELFHATQCEALGTFDYSATAYAERYFWVEASAEYMGITKFWDIIGATPSYLYDQYQIDFFETSLIGSNQQHAYEAGNFLYYVQQLNPATPTEIALLPETYTGFANLFNGLYGTAEYPNLLAYYRGFLKASIDSLTGSSPRLNYSMNNLIKNDINNGTELKFELDADETPLTNEPIEGTGALTFAGAYTAGFYKFTTNCDTSITITPDSDVMIYRFKWTSKDNLGYDLSMTTAAGQPAEIEFGKEDFIMITQASDSSGSIGFSYKAAPTETDITGRWNLTSMYYTDIEGTDEFYSLMLSEFGYTKESYLSETNASVQDVLSELYLIITKTPDGQYAVEFHRPGDYTVMEDVQYSGGNLTAKGQFGDLWANINMTVDGDRMSGVLRAQSKMYIGDEIWTATDVIEIALQHEVPAAQTFQYKYRRCHT